MAAVLIIRLIITDPISLARKVTVSFVMVLLIRLKTKITKKTSMIPCTFEKSAEDHGYSVNLTA
jgi:hypothetical protein